MGRRSPAMSTVLAVIALVLLPTVSNIQANALPASWGPYLWVTWPAGLVLASPLVYLDVRRRHRAGEDREDVTQQHRRSARAADSLAAAVHRQWAQEKRVRLLDRPVPLRLRWASTTRPIAASLADVIAADALPAKPHAVRGDGAAPMAAVLAAVRDRQVVLLGAPGSGKSALALLFVLHQLEHRGAQEPVAVLLTLSSWDPRTEHLRTWLARRIAEEYPALGNTDAFGVRAPEALVTEGRVMAVLDGLDEMPTPLRSSALAALDRAADPGLAMVITCRSAEYEAAVTDGGAFLSAAAVLEIQPLDLIAVGKFLEATRPAADNRWRSVLEKARADPQAPLARVLASPLMVSLARTVYRAPTASPGELLEFAEFDEIERHLLDAFVPAVYQDVPVSLLCRMPSGRRDYSSSKALAWLAFLARHLNELDTGDLAWWQLADVMPRAALALCTGLPVGLLFGVSGALEAGPLSALVLTLIFGSAGALSGAFGHPPVPARVQLRFRAKVVPFLGNFTRGTAIGLGLALALHQPVVPATASGLVNGIALASRVWLDVPTDAAEAPTACVALKRDRTASLMFSLAIATSLGFISGVSLAVNSGLSLHSEGLTGQILAVLGGAAAGGGSGYVAYGRVGFIAFSAAGSVVGALASTAGATRHTWSASLAYGIVFGLASGMTSVLSRAWGRFTLARIWLAASGNQPLRLMRFLDDAHRRGVLRQTGAVYEFRHARIRDHLAQPNPE